MTCLACVGDSACVCEGKRWHAWDVEPPPTTKSIAERAWEIIPPLREGDISDYYTPKVATETHDAPVNLPCPEDCGESEPIKTSPLSEIERYRILGQMQAQSQQSQGQAILQQAYRHPWEIML